jgi:hypothetical protein
MSDETHCNVLVDVSNSAKHQEGTKKVPKTHKTPRYPDLNSKFFVNGQSASSSGGIIN